MSKNLFEGLTFKVAEASELPGAFALRRRIYSQEFGYPGLDEFDESAHHLIACDSDATVVAALRIVGPDQRPFELEGFVSLSDSLPSVGTSGEIGRFCVRRDHRQVKSYRFVHVGMFKLAVAYGRKLGLTDLVGVAVLHLRGLYRLALFESLSTPIEFEHPHWGPVEVVRLNLKDIGLRSLGSRSSMTRLLHAKDRSRILI